VICVLECFVLGKTSSWNRL